MLPLQLPPVAVHGDEGEAGGPGDHDEAGQGLEGSGEADGAGGVDLAEADGRVADRRDVDELEEAAGQFARQCGARHEQGLRPERD